MWVNKSPHSPEHMQIQNRRSNPSIKKISYEHVEVSKMHSALLVLPLQFTKYRFIPHKNFGLLSYPPAASPGSFLPVQFRRIITVLVYLSTPFVYCYKSIFSFLSGLTTSSSSSPCVCTKILKRWVKSDLFTKMFYCLGVTLDSEK